jgi:hypothetical protein
MKKLILSIVAIATISLSSFGQAPEGFKYQAVVRDAGNTILNNQAVGMQIEILQGGIGGTVVYTESFAPTTNTHGLVNLEIGTGTTSDDFTIIYWANDTYFIRTSIDVTGGSSYAVMGTSQLMSVPYALHAKTAGSAIIDNVNDADADPLNEMNTSVVLNGTDLETTDGNGTIVTDLSSLVDDADADASNELQTISRTGTTVTLSNGGGTFEDSVGVYTAGEGVDITNNVVTAAHPAVQTNNPFAFQVVFPFDPPQNLDLGFPSLSETGYVVSPSSIEVLNSGKYLLNYDATLEQDPCGNPIVELSIAINGSTVTSSVISGTIGTGGCFETTSFARSLFLVLNAGDVINVQIRWANGSPDPSIVRSNNFSIVKM